MVLKALDLTTGSVRHNVSLVDIEIIATSITDQIKRQPNGSLPIVSLCMMEQMQAYRDKGRSITQVANKFNVSRTTVFRHTFQR